MLPLLLVATATASPTGTIVIHTETPGLEVGLDDEPYGVTRAGPLVIERVSAGAHTVTIESDELRESHVVRVEAGRTTEVHSRIEPSPSLVRTGVTFLGVAAATAGVFAVGADAGGRDGTGVAAAVGTGLMVSGVVWTLAAIWTGDATETPWGSVGLGLLGGLITGAAVAINP